MSLKRCLVFFVLLSCAVAVAADARRLTVANGAVKFLVATNVLGLSVEGQSAKMTADATLDSSGPELRLEEIHAALDPKTFVTGIGLRDRHMREKVFAQDDGSIPPVQFSAKEASCPKPQFGKETSCSVSGQATIRAAARPLTIALKVREDSGGYRISGDSTLLLSTFGIEPPCQLGACVKDEVKLTFAFQAKSSQPGGGAR